MIHVKTISNDQCRETYTQMTLDTELCTYKWSEGACSVRKYSKNYLFNGISDN